MRSRLAESRVDVLTADVVVRLAGAQDYKEIEEMVNYLIEVRGGHAYKEIDTDLLFRILSRKCKFEWVFGVCAKLAQSKMRWWERNRWSRNMFERCTVKIRHEEEDSKMRQRNFFEPASESGPFNGVFSYDANSRYKANRYKTVDENANVAMAVITQKLLHDHRETLKSGEPNFPFVPVKDVFSYDGGIVVVYDIKDDKTVSTLYDHLREEIEKCTKNGHEGTVEKKCDDCFEKLKWVVHQFESFLECVSRIKYNRRHKGGAFIVNDMLVLGEGPDRRLIVKATGSESFDPSAVDGADHCLLSCMRRMKSINRIGVNVKLESARMEAFICKSVCNHLKVTPRKKKEHIAKKMDKIIEKEKKATLAELRGNLEKIIEVMPEGGEKNLGEKLEKIIEEEFGLKELRGDLKKIIEENLRKETEKNIEEKKATLAELRGDLEKIIGVGHEEGKKNLWKKMEKIIEEGFVRLEGFRKDLHEIFGLQGA